MNNVPKAEQPINQYIDCNIYRHLQQLNKISKQVHECLDSKFTPFVNVANIRQDKLVLVVSSAVWATAIRYRIPEILSQFKRYPELRPVQSIELYIEPQRVTKTSVKKSKIKLTPSAATGLKQFAASIDDEKLSKILHRIASHSQDTDIK